MMYFAGFIFFCCGGLRVNREHKTHVKKMDFTVFADVKEKSLSTGEVRNELLKSDIVSS
jgi:hypothetical protein